MSCNSCPAKGLIDIKSDINDISCGKLNTYDWLEDIPDSSSDTVEVRFKNTRKEFFINSKKVQFKRGDYIAVEADKGHDIGQVSLTGRLATMQMKRKNPKYGVEKQVYRKATSADLEKWQRARLLERPTMLKARQLAKAMGLEMKISDVEYQGDGIKAIFYYIAEDRVDFRELIKKYAAEFRVRIEMKQIGARQEAARIGGIGSCGKELCCSTWRTNLETVNTNAARIQELPHNAQKLTGQCGKLKCCLMYELDSYLEAQSDFPDILLELETDNGIAVPIKKDILAKIIHYAYPDNKSNQLISVSLSRVKEIINLNKRGIKPALLEESTESTETTNSFVSSESDLSILNKKPNHKRKKKRNYSKKRQNPKTKN